MAIKAINPNLAAQWFAKWEDWAKLPRGFLSRVATIESTYNPSNGTYKDEVSSAGARGLMQLMPVTVKDILLQYENKIDPHDPLQAIMGAALTFNLKREYIRKKYGFDPTLRELIAAYNGSLSNAKAVRENKAIPAETIAYFDKMARLGFNLS